MARILHRLIQSALGFCLAVSAVAQSSATPDSPYTPTLTFDVASVRQSPVANSYMVSGQFEGHSSSLHITNFDVNSLLSMAYGVRWDQIVGLKERYGMFNIQAKSDHDADEKLAHLTESQAELEHQHMLQQLLADRFQLKTHWEMRETNAYDLVIGKKGLKMQESKGEPPSAEELQSFHGSPIPALYQRGSSNTSFDFVAHNCPMNDIVEMLSGQMGRPVTDKTGLSGKYNFVLHYLDARITDREADDQNTVPTLDQAIQDQLGLKLEPSKAQGKFLVIDHIEKPSDN